MGSCVRLFQAPVQSECEYHIRITSSLGLLTTDRLTTYIPFAPTKILTSAQTTATSEVWVVVSIVDHWSVYVLVVLMTVAVRSLACRFFSRLYTLVDTSAHVSTCARVYRYPEKSSWSHRRCSHIRPHNHDCLVVLPAKLKGLKEAAVHKPFHLPNSVQNPTPQYVYIIRQVTT